MLLRIPNGRFADGGKPTFTVSTACDLIKGLSYIREIFSLIKLTSGVVRLPYTSTYICAFVRCYVIVYLWLTQHIILY